MQNKDGPLPYTKSNSKHTSDLNSSAETVRLLKEYEKMVTVLVLATVPAADDTKSTANNSHAIKLNFHYIKIKVCASKETISRVKRQATGWEKYL